MPQLSVVMCTVNRADLIAGAAASVLASDFADLELVVVDQSSDRATAEALRPLSRDSRLRYIHTDRVGLSAAYNIGIAASGADLIAFTDDDCLVPSDWASCAVESFERNPDVDLVYGQVTIPPELRAYDGVVPALEFSAPRKLSRKDGFRVYGMGANFAARRRLLDKVQGFDEVLGGGGPLRSSQDFDFQYRAFRAGAVCLLEPSLKVLHFGARDQSNWPRTMNAYGVGDGGFYMKHMRCGDVLAARIFLGRFLLEGGRVLLRPLRRRPPAPAYLSGLLTGIRGSFHYRVDRRDRLYVSREGGAR